MSVTTGHRGREAPAVESGWAGGLDRFGARVALVTEGGGELSYAGLLAEADRFAARLGAVGAEGAGRLLVLLGVRNDVASVAAYLGCLRAGHPVLLLAAGETVGRIAETFAPDATRDAEDGELRLADRPAGGLHPDLAVLLSTSGSTGSPKLVRLSAQAVAANAASIIHYLGITPDERAVTTLPFHYSYGLSVLNSHLMAGASLALTDLSVTHPDFEAFIARAQPTSLAGVPYTHELLAKTGLVERLPASVRTLTQAGGRLAPEKVLALAATGARRGFRFVPMYGQTEATARMAFLPPEQVAAHPDCIGRPIPGGAFRLVDEDGVEIGGAGVAGELVYRGPNVMMGYALTRGDLAKGAELEELRTGDIAERTADGLYRIVGRASRFAKIAGLRIGFDDVEALLRESGAEAVVTGSDSLLVAQVPDADAARQARLQALVAARVQVPEAMVAVVGGAVPRLPSGKPDYGAIRAAGAAAAAARAAALEAGVHPILAGYRRAFNAPRLTADASFQSLGGDSLAYVNVAIAIEKALGRLPPRWEEMPVSALIDLAGAEEAPARRGTTAVGSETLIRLWALALVITGHAAPEETEFLRGGAGILMMLAGYSFARFQKSAFERGEPGPVVRGSLERMILPYYLLMIPLLFFSNAQKSWGWFALVSVFTVEDRGPLFAFWFIETLFHALLIMVVLYALPPVRRWSAARPFQAGLGLLAFALVMKMLVPRFLFDDFNAISLTVDAQFWLFALGFLALTARSVPERLVVLALAGAIAWWDYGTGSSRPLWLLAGLVPLMFVPVLGIPARVAGPLLRIAAASYFIYMFHVPLAHVVHFVLHLDGRPALSIPLMLVGSVAGGLLFEAFWSRGVRLLKARVGPAGAGD
jgi:acyl-CoA synthetase (AMP-forming)/AMP-acid ligase II